MAEHINRRAPMAPAPMRYTPDGAVDWGNMWDSFCELAQTGGPPHRSTLLMPDEQSDPANPAYQSVVAEVIRGIGLVSGLVAGPGPTGWVVVHCDEPGMASWLAEAILAENVQARSDGVTLFVPVGQNYMLKAEIKNVITAVAKTTHYWGEHVPGEVRSALAIQDKVNRWKRSLTRIFGRM
jgi:sirohydrochlorin cobaltochelatase